MYNTCPKCGLISSAGSQYCDCGFNFQTLQLADAHPAVRLSQAKPGRPCAGSHQYGEKKRCPNCGSNDVRAMTRKETIAFYGSDTLVLSLPRKCRECGQEYEVIPSQRGCVLMMVLGAAGTLIGAVFLVVSIWYASQALWGMAGGGIFLGSTLLAASVAVYVRYRQHLQSCYGQTPIEAPFQQKQAVDRDRNQNGDIP